MKDSKGLPSTDPSIHNDVVLNVRDYAIPDTGNGELMGPNLIVLRNRST